MTAPAYQDDAVTVYLGDCLTVLPELADASVDSVVTDPPYGLDFMGKHWDTGAVAFDTAVWGHCLRVLKPGGHLLAFGGTRTHHRLACAIEDAGFEIRDSIAWLYGSGFPKSLDVSKAIDKGAGAERATVQIPMGPTGNKYAKGLGDDRPWMRRAAEAGYHEAADGNPITAAAKEWQGWGTALKPAFEPIVVARKPLSGTVAANVQAHGTGALNIDATRIPHGDDVDLTAVQRQQSANPIRFGGAKPGDEIAMYKPGGRWPTNVVIDEHTAAGIDQQSGISRDGVAVKRNQVVGSDKPNQVYGKFKNHTTEDEGYGGEGGASRFFPTFKTQEQQCTETPMDGSTNNATDAADAQKSTTEKTPMGGDATTNPAATPPPADRLPTFRYNAKAPGSERPTDNGTAHPTVKPLELIRWLVRLVTPPHGLILDPFAGTGTTAEAAIHEHMHAIIIEREDAYLPLITARLVHKPMQLGFDYDIGEFDT